jgi:LysM repeat protein
MTILTVTKNRQHLLDLNGQPLFLLGVNYTGHFDRTRRMWEDTFFDLDLIAHDLRKAQSSGFNAIRIFVQGPLGDELHAGNFDKLDRVLDEAKRANLAVLLVLNDAHSLDLAAVADLNAAVADHLRDSPVLLGYELENKPVFYDIVAARYPEGIHAPVQTDVLVQHYGQRVSQSEAELLQRALRIPPHLSSDLAYCYANALRLFLEFDAAATNWSKQGNGDLLRYITSPDAAQWRHFIHVMDATLAAWLTACLDPLRATDSQHLVTVGWHWPHFAGLPANRALDFQQFHHYGARSLAGLHQTLDYLQGLRRIFPNHPIVLGEFGYSNASGPSPGRSQPVDPSLTALYEVALLCGLQAEGLAGGFKWVLNDMADAEHNPRESNFGVFRPGDQPKPVRDLILRLAELWGESPPPGALRLARDANTGLAFRYTLLANVVVGGGSYQDDALIWQSQSNRPAHLFAHWRGQEIILDATGQGSVTLGPNDLVPGWDRAREVVLHQRQANSRLELKRFAATQDPNWHVLPGVTYVVTPGATGPVPALLDDVEEPQPGPGEHVLVLPDSDHHLDAALAYIRRFAPDFTFAPDEAAGRWPYVTVVGGPEGVSDAQLEAIQAQGARRVERVAGDNVAATKQLLNAMAAQGRRFLVAPPALPQPPANETYTVQPGDTLSGISLKVYGDRRYWHVIFEANRDLLQDPGRIYPGQVLRIPSNNGQSFDNPL